MKSWIGTTPAGQKRQTRGPASVCEADVREEVREALDAKTGLLTGLLTGIQGWECPVALSQTCYGSKSLKVILMDSNFGGHPVLNPPVTL